MGRGRRGRKKEKENGKESRSQEQVKMFTGQHCDVERFGVSDSLIQVLVLLLTLGKLNSLKFSLLRC